MTAPSIHRFQHLHQILMVMGGFLVALVLALCVTSILWLRDRTLSDAETRLSQLTVVIAEQVARSLESVDGVLQVTVERVAKADLDDPAQRAAIHTYLNQQEANLPQTFRFIVMDRHASRIVDSQSATPSAQTNPNSGQFRHMRDNPGRGAYLAPPTQSRQTGEWFFSLSRRLSAPGDDFAGLVTASMDFGYFTDVFKSAGLSDSVSIFFARGDGVRLFRYPFLDAAIGDSYADTEIYREHLPHRKAGVVRGTKSFHGEERISAFRALDGYPVVVLMGDSVHQILAPWRTQAWAIVALGATALLILQWIGAILMRLARRNDALLAEAQDARNAAELASKAADRASRAKSEFLAGVSHDLRTPLNSIIGFSDLLLTGLVGPLTDQQRDYTQNINTSGKHLLDLINNLLDLAKIEANQVTIVEDKFDLHGVITECLRLVSTQSSARRVALQPYAAQRFGLRADPVRLRQIIFNLLSNAIKFTPPGGTVEVRTELVEGGALCIAVCDSGIGMTESEIKLAMQPFRQVENKLTRSHEGTGLGLPLVRSLTELHGGRVSIISAPGDGTTVSVILPRERIIHIDGDTRAA